MALEIRAHAKLNLALALAPPEPPGLPRAGWHRICTWMCAIDLFDDVLVEPLGRGAASTWSAAWAPDAVRPGVIDWPVVRDLAWRALGALERHVGRRLPTRLALRKRVPTGAGLGGGSSDGAAALVGLDRAWGLGLGRDVLRSLGAQLGSDVAFFIDEGDGAGPARPAVVSGFGENLERVAPAGGSEAVLIVPAFGCPTGTVYRAFDELIAGGGHRMRDEEVRGRARGADAISPGLFNDLAAPAIRVRPALGELRAEASRLLGRAVHVTGSGSGLFVVCRAGEGGALAGAVRGALGGAAVRVCRLL